MHGEIKQQHARHGEIKIKPRAPQAILLLEPSDYHADQSIGVKRFGPARLYNSGGVRTGDASTF
jgi:hypothetical protein